MVGVGGIGISAVPGARHAGARRIIAVDPIDGKRDAALAFGATDAFADHDEAADLARSLTNGQGADAAIICVRVIDLAHVAAAFSAVRKAGTIVVTAARRRPGRRSRSACSLTMFQKRSRARSTG